MVNAAKSTQASSTLMPPGIQPESAASAPTAASVVCDIKKQSARYLAPSLDNLV